MAYGIVKIVSYDRNGKPLNPPAPYFFVVDGNGKAVTANNWGSIDEAISELNELEAKDALNDICSMCKQPIPCDCPKLAIP